MFFVEYVVSISFVRRLRKDFEVSSEVHEAWILRRSYQKQSMSDVLDLRMATMVGREKPSRLPFHLRLFLSIFPGRTVSREFRRLWGKRRVGSWNSLLFFCRASLCPSPKWIENMGGICSNAIRPIGQSL